MRKFAQLHRKRRPTGDGDVDGSHDAKQGQKPKSTDMTTGWYMMYHLIGSDGKYLATAV